MVQTKTAIVALAVVAIIIWYWAEWQERLKHQQRMNPLRNPLALLHLAVQRLWRNRSFFLILLACWLLSVGIYRFILDPLIFAPIREQWTAAAAAAQPGGEWTDAPTFHGRAVTIDSDGIAGTGPISWVWRAMPQFRLVDLSVGYSTWAVLILALGIMAVVLMRLWFRRPKWLPSDMHQRLVWPIYLALGGFVVMVTCSGFSLASALLLRQPEAISGAYLFLSSLLPLFLAFAGAVLTAFLWHIVMQVGIGQCWSPHHAIIGAVKSWLPIAWLTFSLALPYTAAAAFPIWRHLAIMPGSILQLAPVIRIVLLFVPWIVLAERANFSPAVVRNFQLIRSRWWDLLVLLPRYLLIMVPVYALLSAASWATIHNPGLTLLLSLTRSTIELVLLVTIVVLYIKLREAEHKTVAAEAVVPAD